MSELFERSGPSKKPSKLKKRIQYSWDQRKRRIKFWVTLIPILGHRVIHFWQQVNVAKKHLELTLKKMQIRAGKSHPLLSNEELDALIFISPQDIQYESLIEYNFKYGRGLILDGEWDLLEKRFDELDIFVAFKEVILERKQWQDTVFFQRMLRKLEKGEILWGCANNNDLIKRCEQLNDLIVEIKENGYRSQSELHEGNADDEIIVNIGRDGDLLFSNSAHRLSIAKILQVERVPIRIAVRHKKWMQFRAEYLSLSAEKNGIAYQPSLHPDLQFLPANHECADRFDLLRKNLSTNTGRLLDIGANLGYFCSRFEAAGFTCVAVENSPRFAYCLKKLKRATNNHFEIIEKSVLDAPEILKDSYEVVLALNIFHHFLKTEETYNKLVYFLENLKCKIIFFESHNYDEEQMVGAYRNLSPLEFVEFIREKTGLSSFILIGHASDGRQIFKIA